jgi:hypothetical protein
MIKKSFGLLIVLAALVTGCATPSNTRSTFDVAEAPPEPLIEIVPAAPGDDFVWVNGYYAWNGTRYVWVRGHWAIRPRVGWVWVRSGWVYVDGRYHFVAGHWSPPGYTPAFRYVYGAPPRRVGKAYRTEKRRK